MSYLPLLALKDKLHPAGQPEHDPVLAVHRHAVHQPCPQALVELCFKVPIKMCFDGRRRSSGATELSERVRKRMDAQLVRTSGRSFTLSMNRSIYCFYSDIYSETL